MIFRLFYGLLLLVCVIIVAGSCAIPIAPTGGPPDRTPPEITGTWPENETVNFDGREVRFEFSEFMNRSSIQQALTIEPDLAIGYDINWSRKAVAIRFDQELPENTTMIIKLGTGLQDVRGNRLGSQYHLALSTGPVINEGTITGRLRLASSGAGEEGMQVFLYSDPVNFEERVHSAAQTDTAGVFTFPYISDGTYLAIWVDDQNRNRTWEQGRESARPFHEAEFLLESQVDSPAFKDLGTIYIERADTTAPQLQEVGLLTETRLRLRFNEEVYWENDAVITVLDSTENPYTQAHPLYVSPEDDLVVFAQSEDPLVEDQRFTLLLEGIADSSGNTAEFNIDPFQGSAQVDTVALRIIGDNREPGLLATEPLITGYSKFIGDESVLDSLKVVEGENLIDNWPQASAERHRLMVYPDTVWRTGYSYQFLAWNPAAGQLRPIEPVIWNDNQLGGMEFALEDTTGNDLHYLTIFDRNGKIRVDTTMTDVLVVDNLPPLSYTVTVFRDTNGNGLWDSGAVMPFAAPEPYFVRRGVTVIEGFTSDVRIEFPNTGSPGTVR